MLETGAVLSARPEQATIRMATFRSPSVVDHPGGVRHPDGHPPMRDFLHHPGWPTAEGEICLAEISHPSELVGKIEYHHPPALVSKFRPTDGSKLRQCSQRSCECGRVFEYSPRLAARALEASQQAYSKIHCDSKVALRAYNYSKIRCESTVPLRASSSVFEPSGESSQWNFAHARTETSRTLTLKMVPFSL